MAYIQYGQLTVGGKQTAEIMHDLELMQARLANLAGWIGAIGSQNLEGHADFDVGTGDGSGFNDTVLQIAAAFDAFMTSGGNREKIERLARGG